MIAALRGAKWYLHKKEEQSQIGNQFLYPPEKRITIILVKKKK